MELYSLLTEIASMVGIPEVDVEILHRQAPNKSLYNNYRAGMAALREIVKRNEHDWDQWKNVRWFESWRSERRNSQPIYR